MVVHDADAELFEKTILKAVEAEILKGKLTAIIDSSPVHGAGAVADTYELVRCFMRQVVRAADEGISEEARPAVEPFCGPKPDIDWQDPAARKAHLRELVAAGMALLVEVAEIEDPAVAEPAELLPRSSTKTSPPTKRGRLRSAWASPVTGSSPTPIRRCAMGASLKEELASRGVRFLAARVAGEVAGWCEMRCDDSGGQVEDVVVLEPFRGRGLARALVCRRSSASEGTAGIPSSWWRTTTTP